MQLLLASVTDVLSLTPRGRRRARNPSPVGSTFTVTFSLLGRGKLFLPPVLILLSASPGSACLSSAAVGEKLCGGQGPDSASSEASRAGEHQGHPQLGLQAGDAARELEAMDLPSTLRTHVRLRGEVSTRISTTDQNPKREKGDS